MNHQLICQNIGIDVSKSSLMVSIAQKMLDQSVVIKSTKSFSNNLSGFERMENWLLSLTDSSISIHYTMEATGVYYENLAYWLYENQKSVSVILAKQAKKYAESLNIKSKNDEIDAKVLAQMGVERKLSLWIPASVQMRTLKQLSRERSALKDEQTAIKNQNHALKHSHEPDQKTLERIKKRLALIDEQIQEIEQDMKNIMDKDANLKERIDNVCTIKGVGFITAISIIAETNGFALFHSRSQLVCYAGYNVVQKQSGTSLNAPTRISKRGNKHIRKTLYFPAISASQHDPKMRNTYQTISDKTNIKMKGSVAVQRKLLVLIYTLFKNNQKYDEQYSTKKTA